MFIFKILLIILIALPVIALASYFYSQMLSFIKTKNAIEDEAIRQSAEESKTAQKSKKSKKKEKKK
jgi:flagellar basal body-associated protein FliL